MSDADLIARTLDFMRERPGLVDSAQELFLELLAALEAQPAPLCKNVRNGVCLVCGSGVLNSGEHLRPELHAATLVADSREALRTAIQAYDGPASHDEGLLDAILGVVSVAADCDRAVAERAWDEGYRQGWADRHEDAQAGYVPSGFQQDTPNHYRESEARND